MKKLLFLLPVLLLVGCSAQADTVMPGKEHLWNYVDSIHDDSNHVTCYVFQLGYRSGISCLPDSQLNTK